MKKYTIIPLLALSCLSCNPLVIAPKKESIALEKHEFKGMKISIINRR